jgi:glycosyltransferase involved in cell wall biosynthesis
MKIIGVDARCLVSRPAGVANFLITALNYLTNSNPEYRFILFTHKEIDQEIKRRLKKTGSIEYNVSSTKWLKKIGVIWFQFKLPFILLKNDVRYIWGPGQVLPYFLPKNIKSIVTIHDVVFLKYRYTMSKSTLIESIIWTNYAIRKADLIWTVSNYTKCEVEENFPKRKCKNILVGSGIDYEVFKKINISEQERQKILCNLGIQAPFILFVGTIEPRKNLSFLLSLMPELAKHDIYLLIIGAKGWKQSQKISETINSNSFPINKVKFAGYITTDELVRLYNIANVFVSVSLNEGFGLPLLEALACGCPAICPNNSGMTEVVENKGILINGWNKDEWINEISNAIFGNLQKTSYTQEMTWNKILDEFIQ